MNYVLINFFDFTLDEHYKKKIYCISLSYLNKIILFLVSERRD